MKNRIEFKKQWSFKMFNWILLTLIIIGLVSLYFFPWYYKWNPFANSVRNNYASFMTADGLITTSTFAFVAFASISPSASGSTLVMNRLGWKGTYILRYPFLLTVSALLTFADSLLTLNKDLLWEIIFGTSFSTLILLVIIVKYTLFNRKLNKNAIKMLVRMIKRSVESNDFERLDKIFRIYWNPLRSTSNTDLVKMLITNDYMLNFLVTNVFKDNDELSPKGYGIELESNKRQYIDSRLESKLKEIFKLNNVMCLEMKLYILGVMKAKMLELNSKIENLEFQNIIKSDFLSASDISKLNNIEIEKQNSFFKSTIDVHYTFTVKKQNLRLQTVNLKKQNRWKLLKILKCHLFKTIKKLFKTIKKLFKTIKKLFKE